MEGITLSLLKFLWAVLLVPMGWLWSVVINMRKEISSLRVNHYETKIQASETYVSKADYRTDLKAIHHKLDNMSEKQDRFYEKISDKLSAKADKK